MRRLGKPRTQWDWAPGLQTSARAHARAVCELLARLPSPLCLRLVFARSPSSRWVGPPAAHTPRSP
eukprot:scaffold38851_cov35-Phaeocystis_antarctica.AAC.1